MLSRLSKGLNKSVGILNSAFQSQNGSTIRSLCAVDDTSLSRVRGVVKWFNSVKGFGFITPDSGGEDLFVHQTNIQAQGFRSLREGESVEFEIARGQDGRTRAVNVTGPDGAEPQGEPGGRYGSNFGSGRFGGGYGGGGRFGDRGGYGSPRGDRGYDDEGY
eukprot:g8957.t1